MEIPSLPSGDVLALPVRLQLVTVLTELLRPATTSGLAIASMVCGILGLVLSCMFLGILGIPAVVCGHMAMHQINNSRNMIVGRGMALTGLICGYLGLLTMLGFILQIVFALAHFP